ncbi:hypothetical protein K474DRAFT_162514 [Panus rudis PR-1116 ss-1]|nr:hypothetical protein K474DRAFT_162514 [Panus rudis PR-1116 ss-1]
MDTVSRSPALDPTSTPFFPGGALSKEDETRGGVALGFRLQANREQYVSSTSSLSISPSEYRSIKSSPSPPQDDRDGRATGPQIHLQQADGSRGSPAIQQVDSERAYSVSARPSTRESSIPMALETIPDSEETPGPITINGSFLPNALYTTFVGRNREHLGTPPVIPEANPRPSSFNSGHIMSSSPSSSLHSGSMFMQDYDTTSSIESQLKASPIINDVLDRLLRCESSIREFQRELGDVTRKVGLLLERSISANSPPEFRDPFAPSASMSAPGLNGHRGSVISNVAPNQPVPNDDISSISHRLSSLSTSVDQLLALQTQHLHTGPSSFPGPQSLPNNSLTVEMASARALPPSLSSAALGHGPPGRAELRPNSRLPGPPMRTWSAGNLDIPGRGSESGPSPHNRPDALLRDKRRSVSAAVLRRDSVAGESLAGSQASREGGPIISKWEQLALSPDLLRSLSNFGVGPPNKIQQRALPFLLKGADIIAQAPPTQERIAAYVIPAIHIALTHSSNRGPLQGPLVVMVSTTVDQATQAQRMIRDLGGPIGIRSALGVGTPTAGSDLSQELRLLHQNMPHIICGTPQKLHALFTSPGGVPGGDVRFLVLDEVDQLIARNLHEFVFNIVKLLPPPRNRPLSSGTTPTTPAAGPPTVFSNFENGSSTSLNAFQNVPRRISTVSPVPSVEFPPGGSLQIERQTALFSNTVPQDVLNLATAIQLREPVRVLVRRDGNVTHADTSQGARGLRQFYLYLAFTASGRSENPPPPGSLGIIGSGRGATSAETVQAREWKLDALADLFDDLEITQAIIHVGGMNALEAVVYKLASRNLEAIPLHGDMNAAARLQALNKFRSPLPGMMRQSPMKILVVYDVQVKTSEVSQIPLIINYDLPKAVEEYAHRVAPAIAPSYSRAGVIVNFVTATGGDVEMLRSIECFYKIKCPEVPMSLRDIV